MSIILKIHPETGSPLRRKAVLRGTDWEIQIFNLLANLDPII